MTWKTSALFKSPFEKQWWIQLKRFCEHLNTRNLVVFDWLWPLTEDFPAGRKGAERFFSPVSLLTSKKTCSLSLCGDTFPCSAACSHETFKNLNDISTPLLNVIETGQWAQKVSVRSDRWRCTCVCIYICVHFPPSPSDCISLISLGNQAEKRSGGKSNKIVQTSSVPVQLLQRALVQLFGVLCTVLVTVQPEGYYCFEEDEIMLNNEDNVLHLIAFVSWIVF